MYLTGGVEQPGRGVAGPSMLEDLLQNFAFWPLTYWEIF